MTAEVEPTVSKITSKYQITVPREVRHLLHVSSGDELEWIRTKDGFTVRRKVDPTAVRKWKGFLKELAGRDADEVVREMRGD